MIDLIFGADRVVADFVQRHIPGCRPFERPRAIGFVEDGTLIGGTVYTNWDPRAGVIELSTAATTPRWLSPRVLHAIFSYPFDEIGCQMVVLRVSERNTRMVKIAKRFGFEGYLIDRLRGRDEAEWVFTLTAEAWRDTKFERSGHGQG